jgi:hypothetical protein
MYSNHECIVKCCNDILGIEGYFNDLNNKMAEMPFIAKRIYDTLLEVVPKIEDLLKVSEIEFNEFEVDEDRISKVGLFISEMFGEDSRPPSEYIESKLIYIVIDVLIGFDYDLEFRMDPFEYEEENIPRTRAEILDIITVSLSDVPSLTPQDIFAQIMFMNQISMLYKDILNLPIIKDSYKTIIVDNEYAIETIVFQKMKELSLTTLPDLSADKLIELLIGKPEPEELLDSMKEILISVITACFRDIDVRVAFEYIETSVALYDRVEKTNKEKFINTLRTFILTHNISETLGDLITYHRREAVNENLTSLIYRLDGLFDDMGLSVDDTLSSIENLDAIFNAFEFKIMDLLNFEKEQSILTLIVDRTLANYDSPFINTIEDIVHI